MVGEGKSKKGSRNHYVDTKHRYHRIMALAAVMFVVVIMTTALIAINDTDNAQADSSDYCGDDLTWTYTESDHRLTITGKGAMYDYASGTSPWNDFKTSITTLELPSGMTTIGTNAFNGCTELTGALIIPNRVTTIGDHAFDGCTKISTLTIGSSVTTIGDNAFYGCSALIGNLTIPNSVTTIGDHAFAGSFVSNAGGESALTIGSSVKTIGDDAFNGCIGFKGALTIPNSVVTIGENAFKGCTGFNSTLTIGSSVTTIGAFAFDGCSSLTSTDEKPLTIPASIASIGANAFTGCTKILDIKIITGCIGINTNAFSSHKFYETNGTTEITSRNVGFVGHTFNGNAADSMKRDNDTFESHHVTYDVNGGSSAAPTQPDVLEGGTFSAATYSGAKEGYSFTGWRYDSSIYKPNTTVIMGTSDITMTAVWINNRGSCGDNLNWTYDLSNKELTISGSGAMNDYGPTGYPWYGFKNEIVTLVLPPGITTIGTNAFNGCTAMTVNLPIPNSVTAIGSHAFDGCTNISGLTIGSSVKTIGDYAFNGCTAITGTLTIPDSVTAIGDHAFDGCIGLGTLAIGSSVTTIGGYAFNGCTGFTGTLTMAKSVTEIGERAFYGCTGITGLTFEDNSEMAEIAMSAFEECTGFTGTLTIPDKVTIIGERAFYGCNNFNGSLTIGTLVTTIGSYAFHNCSKLTGTLTIPKSVKTIGSKAFYGCSGLTALTIDTETSIKSIGTNAFEGCTGMKIITIAAGCAGIDKTAFQSHTFYDSDGITKVVSRDVGFVGYTFSAPGLSTIDQMNRTTSDKYHVKYDIDQGSVVAPTQEDVAIGCTFKAANYTGTKEGGKYVFNGWTYNGSIYKAGDDVIMGSSNIEMKVRWTDSTHPTGDCGTNLRWDYDPIGYTLTITASGDSATMDDYSIGGTPWNAYRDLIQTVILPTDKLTNIGKYAFSNCISITTVKGADNNTDDVIIIPDKIITIDSYAFYNCSGVSGTLTIGTGVKTIGDYAFSGCSGLTNALEIPDNVETIGNYAFERCYILEAETAELTIGSGLTKIGEHAFDGCVTFTKLTFTGGSATPDSVIGSYAFYACPKLSGDLIISNFNTIESYAFSRCVGLKGDLTIGSGVKTIGDYAFDKSYASEGEPTSVLTLGPNLTTIGEHAFDSCIQLKSTAGPPNTLTIPDSVTTIGAYAFSGCTGFDGILNIGKGVKTIGDYAFNGCTGFTVLKMTDCNEIRDATIGNYAFNKCSDLVSDLNIPDKYGSIGEYAFFGSFVKNAGGTSLTIGKGVKSIGINAFNGCVSFMNLVIESDTDVSTDIGDNAFYGCSGFLNDLTIPDRVVSIGDYAFFGCYRTGDNYAVLDLGSKLKTIGNHAFDGCTRLTVNDTQNLVIPDSVLEIGYYAFYECTGLNGSLTLGSGLLKIGEYAFADCTGFTGALTIPNNVMMISESAFKGCTGLNDKLTIGYGVMIIGNNAFSGCSSITSLELPSNSYSRITTIGTGAFSGCSVLTGSITIPNSVMSIGNEAFKDCGFDGTLTLGSGVMAIGDDAFNGCELTGNLIIPGMVSSIGKNAFVGNYTTTTNDEWGLTIGYRVMEIGDNAFSGCTGFKTLTINSGMLVDIGENVFGGCTGITGNLTIPDSVTTIGEGAFYGCFTTAGDGVLTIGYGVTEIGKETFKGCIGFKTLVIKNGLSNTTLNTIGESAFEGCKFNGDLAIPNGVTSIGTNAFNGCYTGDTCSLTLGKNILTIGEGAFYGCTAFSNQLTLPDSLITLERYAFQNCTGFTGVLTLPDNLTTVNPLAFSGCQNITAVSIPSSANVSGGAFDGCTGLTRISAYPGSTIDSNAFPVSFNYWKMMEGQPVPITCGDSTDFIGYEFTRVAATINDFNRISPLYSWKVTYDANGGVGDVPVQNDVKGYSTFTVQDYKGTKEGHVFYGWEYQHVTYKPGDSIRMRAEDMILVAVWLNLYNIVYDVDGGSSKAPVQDPLISGVMFRLKDYTGLKFGYKFDGWQYNGKVYSPGAVLYVGNSDILLIAVWKTVHELIYNLDGGSGEAPSPEYMMEGKTFTVSSYSGTKEGFEFDGWLFDGTVYQPGDIVTMGTRDIVMLANWSKIHQVTYDINGGTGEVPVQGDVAEGDTFTIKECTATKKGYWLDGWIYINDVYHAGDVVTMGTTDITLIANWKEGSPSHHVTYDTDGGSGEAPKQADVKEDSTFLVKTYSGTKDGFTFKGWSYGGKTYQTGDKITMGKEDIVLKAIWEEELPFMEKYSTLIKAGGIAAGAVLVLLFALFLYRRRY